MNTPTLILLPGLDGEGLFFNGLTRELGHSVPTQRILYPRDMSHYQALADWVLTQIDPEEPFILLGESFGGPLAMTIAQQRPQNLKGLILVCSFSEGPPGWAARLLARFYPWLIRRPSAARGINAMLFNGSSIARAQEILDCLLRTPHETIAARIVETSRVSLSHFLEKSNLPMLILTAKRDRLLWRDYPVQTLLACRKLTIANFNTAHPVLEYVPKSAAKLISRFIAGMK